jgi:DNA topoisomerase-6 subunit B
MEGNMRARQRLHDYVKHTAVVNPHARIELREPGLREPLKFERGTDQLPAETEEIRPHPHGVELGTLLKMLAATESYSVSGFMQEEFTRVGKKTADSVLDNFRDRYYGREMAWRVPQTHEDVDTEAMIIDAVANKSADATAAFAQRVTDTLSSREQTAHHEVREIVDSVANAVGTEFDETFGTTVRENAVKAAWNALTASLRPDLYQFVEEATSTRKDDQTVDYLADRLDTKFTTAEDGRHRLTREQLKGFVDYAAEQAAEELDATVGDTARENVIEVVWDAMRTIPDDPPKVGTLADDRDASAQLLEAMRETNILSPPTDCLSPITDELVEEGLRKEFDADFYAAATRDADVHGGDPFIVEAGIAYGGEIEDGGQADVMRFANRVPLVYQRGACATTDVVKSIGWRNYGLDQSGGSGIPTGPAVIMIHVASTNVPFTSESKDAIANVPEIEDEIELAIREAARELKSYLNRRQSLQKRREKQDVIGRILPEMATKLAEVTGRGEPDVDSALARIMNNISVERQIEEETVTLTVANHSERTAELEITDILSHEPANVDSEASVVDMDGEWFLQWQPSVSSGSEATLAYTVPTDAEFDITVDGIEDERLTVDA